MDWLPRTLHKVEAMGNIALCDGKTVDDPPRGWTTVWGMVTCPACINRHESGEFSLKAPEAPTGPKAQ